MNELVKKGNYALFLADLDDVKVLYSQGKIKASNNNKFAELLGVSPTPASSPGWAWVFDDRTDVIDSLGKADQRLFLRLFRIISLSNNLADLLPNLNPNRVQLGLSGNGNENWLRYLFTNLHTSQTLRILKQLMPNVLKIRPGLVPRLINDTGFYYIDSTLIQIQRKQRLVHLARTDFSVQELKQVAQDQQLRDGIFTLLDYLPEKYINSHGQNSVKLARSVASLGTKSTIPFEFVSLNYPTREDIANQRNVSNVRLYMAFSSPTVLSLSEGDVLFVTHSFLETIGLPTYPVLCDQSVYCISQWLELRGVTILFSAGGNKNSRQNLKTIFGSGGWPGIVVGGVDANGQFVQSNYGPQVTCYARPSSSMPDFDESSGATSFVAGLVVRAQTYAKKRGRFLTPAEVRSLLGSCGPIKSVEMAGPICLPEWENLAIAINTLIP
ncbi:S8/S53 family peptidase [Spirosoma validum]|uniref:S8/S53 family peptidase n=1 Tax=Spirosoma validum TaxID=2771355 RepID=A0A927B4N6_9BACT|nr:hypothetical protein [Spirosoma validum]MBD2755355.1 hypothetical protein [Spirosoma validum]